MRLKLKQLTTKGDTRPYFKSLAAKISAAILLTMHANAQTPYVMSGGNYSEGFDDIANTTNWPNGFNGPSSQEWRGLPVDATGVIPSATRITAATNIDFKTGSTGGVQRGTTNIQLLSTGSADNTTSTAIQLSLDFTGRIAGSVSFNVATVFNGSGNRVGTLRLYGSTDGSTFTEITGTNLPYAATNNVIGSATLSAITLPASFNNSATATLRFYYHNGTGGSTGSRPKISIDNLAITSTGAPILTFPTSPIDNATGVSTTANLIATFDETVQKGTSGNVIIKKTSDNSVVDTIDITTAAVTVAGAVVTIDPAVTLDNSTEYYVTIDANAFKDNDTVPNNYLGLSSTTAWSFTTLSAVDATPPTLASTSPVDNATGVAVSANLVATFDETVQKGTLGNVVIKKTIDDTVVDTIDITTAAVTVAGAVVTIDPAVTLDNSTEYYVTIDANAFKDNAASPNNYLGLSSTTAWSFTTLAPVDSTPPTLATTSPIDNATNVSTTANLIATFDETVQKGTSGKVFIKKTSDNSVVDMIDITTAAVTVAGAVVTINPAVTLANSTEYYVTIDANAFKDNATSPNNYAGLSSTTDWSFTTEAPVLVWINEIHYDNTGTDTGEFVEIAGTAGVDLTGWTIVPYNGNGGVTYTPTGTLSGTIDNEGGTGFGAISVLISGLQNGAPDGLALVNGSGTVIEFLSYEGVFTAANGPALGLTSTDIGISEAGTEPVGQSLQRNNSFLGSPGAWSGPKTATAGSLNDVAAVPDGSGIATIANLTPASPLLNSTVFGRNLSSQTAAISLTGTYPGLTITDVTIEVPAAITGLLVGNVSLTGAGSASVIGNTITISGAAVTTSTGLTVTISGLSTPDTSLDVTNDGNYPFTVATKQSGGTLTAISTSPIAYVVVPIANIRDVDANGVPLDLNDKVAVQGVCTEEDFNSNATTSAFLQEVSGSGVNIFSASVDSPYLRGNEYVTLGNVIQFSGLTEVSFTSVSASVFNLGVAVTQPTPITVTLAAIMLDPESYEGKLVKIVNLSPTDATGWPPATVIPLTDDGGTTILNAYIQSGSTATTSPAFPAAITGVFGQFDNLTPFTAGYQIQPRDPADIVSSGLTPFQTWATGAPYNLVGNDALFDADPDNDGVSNGIEFIVGSSPTVANDASAFIPNITVAGAPGSRVATIVYRRTDASIYLNSVLETSPDLDIWSLPIDGFNGASIVVDDNFYGAGIDKVTVTLDANGPRGFVRLRAVATP